MNCGRIKNLKYLKKRNKISWKIMERYVSNSWTNGYKKWEVESQKFVAVRDVIVDETNYLKYRPVVRPEGVTFENLRMKQ